MTASPSNIIPFAFEDRLVRVYKPNGEPWFVGKDVCEVLDISKHHQALDRLDDDERGTYSVGTPRGDQTMVIISEAGVFRLIFTSRKPEAERFKRWLAHEVLPTLRKHGTYTVPGHETTGSEEAASVIDGEPIAIMAQKLSMVRESRLIHGVERARLLWDKLGLPNVPGGNEIAIEDGLICLKAILALPLDENDDAGTAFTILHAIMSTLDDDANFDAALRERGIRVLPQQDGFVIANNFGATFQGAWKDQRAYRKLLHVPGAKRWAPMKFGAHKSSRGVFIPADAIDSFDEVTAH